MTREDTRPHQDYSVAQNTNGYRCRFILLIVLLAITACVYYFATRSETPFGDRSEQSMFTSIPKVYTKLEAVDPEERDVFQGFEIRTSFLPDEIVVPRNNRYKEVYEGNVTSDILIWGGTEKQRQTPTRYKRMSRFTFTSEDYEEDKRNDKKRNQDEDFNDELENDTKEEYTFSQDQYDDNDRVESIVRPKPHVDRGPLDDVVEQIRSQPELEEGEMISSDHIYKTGEVYAGIHAFWKGQGNRETIRTTQANIMKQYMDAQADPCHDFYQYACGNWASLNPIPADKAGYDTFEMLRENLDSVLKDLLEFKPSDNIRSTYPGSHLALDDDFLKDMLKKTKAGLTMKNIFVETMDFDSLTNAHNASEKSKYSTNKKLNESEIVNRIRRYLNQKLQKMVKPLPKIVHKYFNKVNHKGEIRKQRLKRHLSKTAPPVFKPKPIHKHRKNGLKKRHPRKRKSKRKFTPKSTEANVGRKLHMYTPPHRDKSRSERDTLTQQLASLDEIFNEDSFDINDPANGDAILKARYLFRSCMNYEILKKRGHQPLLDLLHLLGGWPILNSTWDARHFDWLELMAKLRLYNNDILISEWVGPDIKNSDEFVIQFDQTNLGLPTRDYFLQESNKPYLEAYKMYLIKIAMLLGGNKEYVLESAEKLIEFEIKLAKITSAPEDRRNVSELYRRMPLHKLEKLVPEVRWRHYLCVVMNRTVHPNETVVLFALTYVRHLVQLIKQTEPCILSNYLLWRFVRHRVNNLDDRFQTAKQQFYFTLFGREQAPPRWKNCISQVNSNMGMALGSMFVKKYFDEMSKNDTLTMTRDIQQAFRELLHKTDWIDDKTKKLAALKVDAMMLRIGYPDFILKKDELDERYKEVRIHPDKYFENILNILQHLSKMEQSRIGQPVNKTLWNTAPAVVNAYYSRNKNQIMFPAGILQPPFYHRDFPRSLNYGGIGVVIGHEITHGFDDKGRLFDCNGNLHRWWSDSAIEAFHRRAQCLIDQYGQYVVPEVNMKLDGVNTQGENIADNGGVKQAFRAYLHWLEKNGPNDETLPGLNHTHTQLFFLNFAQVWCGAMRPEAMRNKLKTAVHSPGRFRVIGTLSNSHDFAREFRCAPGTPMNPKHKCTVW